MKGFPKTINTGQDLINCLPLVKADEITKEDVLESISQIENLRSIRCPIVNVSDDRKSVTVRYCVELAAGQTVNGVVVSTVEHIAGDGDDDAPTATVVTLKKPLPADADVLLVPAPVDPLDRLGITQTQLDEIKEALK